MTPEQRRELVQAFTQLDQVIGSLRLTVNEGQVLMAAYNNLKLLMNKYVFDLSEPR
jgi:hypothetical protein